MATSCRVVTYYIRNSQILSIKEEPPLVQTNFLSSSGQQQSNTPTDSIQIISKHNHTSTTHTYTLKSTSQSTKTLKMSRQLTALLLGLLNFLQLTSSHPTPEPDAPQSPAHALIHRVGKYYLECTHGKSAAACLTIYGTYCDDNGKM